MNAIHTHVILLWRAAVWPHTVSDTLKRHIKPSIKSYAHKVTKAYKTHKTRLTIVQAWSSHHAALLTETSR